MKKLLLLIFVLAFAPTQAQEWGNVKKNVLTMKEIAPVWPGCESKSGTGKDHCFRQHLMNHVARNFKYPAEAYKNNEEGIVKVEFEITTKGEVAILAVSGGTPSLQEEAKRNILAIPKMKKPGMMGGEPKAIKYVVPFNFKTGKK